MRVDRITPHADRTGAVWTRLALRAGGVPDRRDLDPAALGEALPWSILLDRIAPEVTRMRVGGSHVATLLGTDPAGVPLSALVDSAGRTTLAAAVRRLFDGPAPVRLSVTLPRGGLHRGLGGGLSGGASGHLSLWPLADGTGAVTRAIGVLDLPQPPRVESRLSVQDWHGSPSVFAVNRPVAARAAESGRPFLRLVVSNA